MKIKKLIMILFLISFIIGCGGQFQQMSAVDKAAVVAKEITKTYLDLYNIANGYTINGTPVQKEYFKDKINPKLNEAKKSIIIMDEAVAVWKRTGIDSMEAQKKQTDLNRLLQDIIQLLVDKT